MSSADHHQKTCVNIEDPQISTTPDNSSNLKKDERSWTRRLEVLTSFHAGYFRITMSLSAQALLWRTLSYPPPSSEDTATTTTTTGRSNGVRDLSHVLPSTAFVLLWAVALTSLVVLSTLFLLRCLLRFRSVRQEFTHRIGVNYLFAPWISWLLLLQSSPIPCLRRGSSPTLYVVLWWVFSLPILALEVKICGQWFTTKGKRFLSAVANPTSQMSVVANMVSARAAAEMGWKEAALCVFAFGMAHYLVLFVTLYQRLNDRPLPASLRPVFFLFFAAPSFASLAWSAIVDGTFDVVAKMLFFLSLFLFAALVSRPTLFAKSARRFGVAWWAYSFPLTALAMDSIGYAQAVKNGFTNVMMLAFTAVSVFVVMVLILYTVIKPGAVLPSHDPFVPPSSKSSTILPCTTAAAADAPAT